MLRFTAASAKFRSNSEIRFWDTSNVRAIVDGRILARQSEAAPGGFKYDPPQGSSLSLCGSLFSIPWWCIRFEGMNETSRDPGYFIDSNQEHGLIGSRGFVKTADFSHELERRGLNLFAGDGRIEVEKCFDIPAHSSDLNQTWLFVSLVATKIRSYVAPAEFAALKEVQRWRA